MGDLGGDELQSKNSNLFLQIMEHPDGTITRPAVPLVPASAAGDGDSAVLSKDVPVNPDRGTWLRIYLPNDPALDEGVKLPVVLFFHGGGFVLFSPATAFYHAFCEQMARALPAAVVSLDYRLAPEHRLPAAYDDAEEALLWLRAQAQAPGPTAGEPWLARLGDFSRCFLMGSSSGANMAYHVGLRAAAGIDLRPLRLAGLVLNQPYFGGAERTPSEAASEEDPMLPLRANDLLWRLALPKGAGRGHEFCDPAAAPPPPGQLRLLPWCFVAGCGGDPLVDRQRGFVKMLEGGGARVVARVDDGGCHAVELFDPLRAEALFAAVREFVYAGAGDDAVAAS